MRKDEEVVDMKNQIAQVSVYRILTIKPQGNWGFVISLS